jgi:hypothetical protein
MHRFSVPCSLVPCSPVPCSLLFVPLFPVLPLFPPPHVSHSLFVADDKDLFLFLNRRAILGARRCRVSARPVARRQSPRSLPRESEPIPCPPRPPHRSRPRSKSCSCGSRTLVIKKKTIAPPLTPQIPAEHHHRSPVTKPPKRVSRYPAAPNQQRKIISEKVFHQGIEAVAWPDFALPRPAPDSASPCGRCVRREADALRAADAARGRARQSAPCNPAAKTRSKTVPTKKTNKVEGSPSASSPCLFLSPAPIPVFSFPIPYSLFPAFRSLFFGLSTSVSRGINPGVSRIASSSSKHSRE